MDSGAASSAGRPPGAVKLTGRVPPEKVRLLTLPSPPPGLLSGFADLGEATSVVSDALDALGAGGVLGAAALRCSLPGARMVGRALTVRNVARTGAPAVLAREGRNLMGEIEAHNLAEPGDVIVIEGVAGSSNMGGVAAVIGRRKGEAGAVVAGGVRDIGESRRAGYPIWSSEVTPLTGKWRVETVEINGVVDIHGVRVTPGDLVVADENGVCFVPLNIAQEVLAFAQKKARAEQEMSVRIETASDLDALLRR